MSPSMRRLAIVLAAVGVVVIVVGLARGAPVWPLVSTGLGVATLLLVLARPRTGSRG